MKFYDSLLFLYLLLGEQSRYGRSFLICEWGVMKKWTARAARLSFAVVDGSTDRLNMYLNQRIKTL